LKIVESFYGEECDDMNLSFKEDMAFDSLSMVSMMLELEEQFDISFDESDMNISELQTLADVVQLVYKYKCDSQVGK